MTKNSILQALRSLSEEDILSLPGMAGVAERDRMARNMLGNRKKELVDRLTVNEKNPKAKAALEAKLNKRTLEDLEEIAALVPATNQQTTPPRRPPIYQGTGPSPTVTNAGDDDYRPTPLARNQMNWVEEKRILDASTKSQPADNN